MILFQNNGRLVENESELPDLRNADIVFADFETTSCDRDKKSVNPWHDCWPAGVAITVDDCPEAWYIPVAHLYGTNLPEEPVIEWWHDIITTCNTWSNQNVKYDAHVSANGWGVMPECELFCTLTHAKIIDSDRIMRGGYGLDVLSRDWLKQDISHYELALQKYLGRNNKDYGRIPADVCGVYACQDVFTGRRLHLYEHHVKQDKWQKVWDTETALTQVLFQMERHGIRIDPTKLKGQEAIVTYKLIMLMEELNEIVGWTFRPNVNADCHEVLCGKYGLPVLGWTDSSPPNPSFDKEALYKYIAHPFAPKEVVEKMLEFRSLNTWLSMFLKPYQTLHVDGQLHPTYNQCVRTGRLSCSKPNQQQLDKRTKELVFPDDEHSSFLSVDYSQIEFRIIAHYIKDERCIKAYAEDPDTDFHTWVAELCEIHRRPAKTVNFLMGYGGGKGKLISALSQVPELIEDLGEIIEKLRKEGKVAENQEKKVFEMLAERKAEMVYTRYHDELPTLKRTSYHAGQVLETRGCVYDLYGRPRHLPADASYRTFNTLCQASAADIQKERMVAVAEMLRGTPITIRGLVHDETVYHGPTEAIEDPRTQRDIVSMMEDVNVELRVPIRASFGTSNKNWAEAAKGEKRIPFQSKCRYLEHLRH